MRPSDPFADRYTKLRLVGRGGFGVVYRAWDTEMERDIALKLLNPDLAADADWRKRFRQEATAASKLNHPNITIVFDRGEYESQPFIVMEFVEGEPLSKVIEQRLSLSDPERLFLIEQLCDGLHYAHQRHIVHRDVKPVNLVVREDHDGTALVRTLKILDFGIAKVVNTGQTSTGGMMFTPSYVSPEQIRGDEVDRRSDMFAVGAVAYELLVFKKAFDITSKNPFTFLEEVKQKIVAEPHLPMAAIRPDIDPELSGVVDRALAKAPEDRFKDLAEMRRSLHRIRIRLEENAPSSSQTTIVLNPKVQAVVKLARQALEADDPTAAVVHLQEALRSASNKVVKRFIEQSLEEAQERQAAKRLERRAREEGGARGAIDFAKRAFERGDTTLAIRRLDEFQPAELVAEARDELARASALVRRAERIVAEGTADERQAVLLELEAFAPADLVLAQLARLRARDGLERAADARALSAIESAREAFTSGKRSDALESLAQFDEPRRVATTLDELREANQAIDLASNTVRSGTRRTRAEALDRLGAFPYAELVASVLSDLRTVDKRMRSAEDRAKAAEERAALEKAAKGAIDGARARFAKGEHAEAVAALRSFVNPTLVADALAYLERLAELVARTGERVRTGTAGERRAAIDELARAGGGDLTETSIATLRALDAKRSDDEQRHREEQHNAAAAALIKEARAQFDRGDRSGPIARLEAFDPPHPSVTAAATELREQVRLLEEEAKSAIEEAARSAIAKARKRFAEGSPQAAIDGLRRFVNPSLVADAVKNLEQIAAVIARAEERVRTGAAGERRTAIDELSRAGSADLTKASIAALRKLDASRTAEEQRRAKETQAAAAAAKRARIELETAAKALEARARDIFITGRADEALRLLARFEEPALVAGTLTTLQAAAAEIEAARAAVAREPAPLRRTAIGRLERRTPKDLFEHAVAELRKLDEGRRAAEQEAEAARVAADARQQFARGEREAALKALQAVVPALPPITEALEDLRRQDQQLRAAQEDKEKERKRLEAEHAGKLRDVAQLLADADAAGTEKRFDDAAGLLNRAWKLLPDATDLQAARKRLARAIEAEDNRVKRQKVVDVLDQVPPAIERGDFAAAAERLTEAGALGATAAETGPFREQLRAAQVEHSEMAGALTAFRRATAAARTIESADARLKALDKTLASTISAPPAGRAAAALWPEYQAAVHQARELREEARARQAEEEKERKRLEAEKAAKGREVATLVADADKAIAAKRFDDAAGLLDRGSTLLPDSTDLARARTRLARAVDAEEKRANRQQVKGLLDQVPAAVDGARFAEAGERLTEAEGLGATPAEAGPLRENLRAAEVAHAQISGALAALKEAVASARATPAMEARVKALDAALATPISAAPTPRAAAGLWPEYQDALQQARGLRQEAAIAEARRRVELALSERSVRKAERALQAAEGAFPGGARWNALRQQVDALRAARAAEPSLLGSTVRQVRQNPLALWIAAAVLAVVLGAAAWVLWPKGPVDPAGKTPPETPAKSSGNPNPAVPAGSPEPAPSDNKPAPADPPSAPAKPPVTAPAAGTPPPTLTPADRARLTLMLNEGQLAQMVSAVQTFRGRGIVDSTLDTMERDAVRIQRSRVSNARQGAGKVPGAAGTAAYREAQKFEQEGNAPRTPSAAFSSLAQAERLYRQAANEAPPVNTPPVPSAGGATTPSSLPGAPAGTPEPPAGGKPPETRPVDKPADPKPTPPPPANPPAASPSAPSDEALIQQTLQQYSAAMSAMNPAAVAAVYPGANRGMLANTFRGFSEYRYQLQPASPVQINGNSATARCTLKMQTNSGQQGRQTQPDRNLVVRLAKTGNRWVIVGFGG